IAFGKLAPGSKRAGRRVVNCGLILVMHIGARAAGAMASIFLEYGFQHLQLVRFDIEVREVGIAVPCLISNLLLHRLAIVAVERVALDKGCFDLLAAEDLLEDALDRRGAGPRRACDGNDGMACGHDLPHARSKPRWPKSGARSAIRLGWDR